ncbi:MAG: hypothetical protein GKR91_05945 [Pseudomonadales bacterium]|nr:hypothetical protein [Pseudomonadales bacterium]
MAHTPEELAKLSQSIFISPNEGEKLVKTIELMQKYKDKKNDNFSYYHAFLGNRAAQEAFKANPIIEKIVAREIKSNTFKRATEFRDALTPVCKDRSALKKLLGGKQNLAESLDYVESRGGTAKLPKRVHSAMEILISLNLEILKGLSDPELNKIHADLKKIKRKTIPLLKTIDRIKADRKTTSK